MKVKFIKVDNCVERYLFEVFCSMKTNSNYNSFETH